MLRIDARRSGFESIGVDECRETASFLRVTKKRLASDRQRELADEIAQELEDRAAQASRSS